MANGTRGAQLHELAARLFPIPRSLTGPGYRETLAILEDLTGPMRRHRFASGTRVFDWTIPDEWSVTEAYVRDPDGRRILDIADTNLHLVGYSEPVRRRM